MTEEPYRWLEAISNRREYIQDRLKSATPVFAVSRPEGIVLVGVGQGCSKIFEIYDRHALAALGHPVDIEKLRQSAIEAAHVEGFTRSPGDVTLRRLISFSLSSSLKNAFEQVLAPPLIVESIFAELGEAPARDSLVRLHYDGDHRYETSGVLVAHSERQLESEAGKWIGTQLEVSASISKVVSVCLFAWSALMEKKKFESLNWQEGVPAIPSGKVLEAALLDRKLPGSVHYRVLDQKGLVS